jgi:membrane-bound ClpP family serine protease
MGIGAGIFLIAVGAILTFAVHTTVNGISLQAIGVILMIVGALASSVTHRSTRPCARPSSNVTTSTRTSGSSVALCGSSRRRLFLC